MNQNNNIMDKNSFDAAMKLNHGRTTIPGDTVCLIDNNLNRRKVWINVISIFPEEETINAHDGTNEMSIRFDEFLIRFKKFYDYGRV